jgi:fructokinase
MTSSFVVAGESLVDVVIPSDGSAPHNAVGGGCLNIAVGLARLDVPTTLVTRIGDDELGRLTVAHLEASNVSPSPGSVVPGGTTSTATARLDEQQAATYEFDVVWGLPSQKIPAHALGLHVGSLGAALEPGRASVVDLVRQARAEGLFVSYDPNIRPFFLQDRQAAWRDVQAIAASARLVKLSDEDLRLLRPDSDEDAVCRELLAGADTELVVLTRGSQGAVAFTRRATLDVPAPPTRVVDTVGAGDSFMSAMLAVLCGWDVVGRGPGWLEALDDSQVSLLVQGAVRAAAVTCSRRGANPPTRQDLPPRWPAG